MHEKYGDFYEFYMGSTQNIVISRPDLAEKVWGPVSLKNTKFIYRTSYCEGINEIDIGTKGIVFNRDLESWALNRRFLNSILAPSFLRESINLSNKVIDQLFEYWKIIEKEGMQIDVCEWLITLGADIVSTTATGKSMAAATKLFNSLNIENKKSLQGIWENGVKFCQSIHLYTESVAFMMLIPGTFRRNFPFINSINKKYLDNRDWVNEELDRMVSEKQKEIENTPFSQPLEPNILTLLLTTNTERDLDKISVGKFERPLTKDEVISIIREVFTGGLDTTSNTLSYMIFYLAKHRDVYLKIRQEVLDVYGTLNNPVLTLESYGKLKYIEAVIYESLRIFPTISNIPRAATEDIEFDGFTIKADTTVHTDFFASSYNPKYFKDPETFNPDRFLTDKESLIKYVFMPFGNGVRVCPGRAWAIVQMKTFLVKLVCTFDIDSNDKNDTPKYAYHSVKRPVDIFINVKTRNG
ncbi:13247_t:CDS:1 [Racocetra fulgida]|uniref:13247_t:CDS:1 n=1 Tax=Racocetra fulgida TaxID=60492 RepID=A0A9N9EV61_9GLOM|nr:13247_t:CDS:1 [Racocetra fulgida]